MSRKAADRMAKAAEKAARTLERDAARARRTSPRPPAPAVEKAEKTAGDAIDELAFDLARGAGITATHEELALSMRELWQSHFDRHRQ